MKKLLFISLTVLLLTFNSYRVKSQGALADGTIAPDFTLVDLNGTTHHLYDYLNAGKTVVIDLSAVWCGPCWTYHSSGALEDFYTQHGPSGDNTAMVFFIEGDQGTLAQLNGGSGSQGNWVAGTPYPIIPTYAPNGNYVTSQYSVTYFPTCYMICALDKKTKLVNQYTTAQLNTAMGSCPPTNIPPVSNFSSLSTSSCTGSIQFTDKTTNIVTSWLWDFGDGQTSTLQNPSHTYTANGTYTISLKSINNYGNNTSTKTNYININLAPTPSTTGASSNIPASLILNASGSGTLNWYNLAIGGNIIKTGTTYTTPVLNNTTTYYVENEVTQTVQSAGKSIKSGGNYYTNIARWGLKFNAIAPLTIQTVKVYSNASGNRSIWLENSNGVRIDSVIVNIPTGEQTVTLNLNVPTGIDYKLSAGANCKLWRDSIGASYPYNVSNLISITGNTSGTAAAAYYYYFYDWKILPKPCISERAPVTATINTAGINEIYEANLEVFPNPSNGEFTLNLSSLQKENIIINLTDINGNIIYLEKLNAKGEIRKKYNLAGYPKGIYILSIITNTDVYKKKVIIE